MTPAGPPVETTDVRDACDRFRAVFEETEGADGYVSIEVSPGVAHRAEDTVAEAHRLWQTVQRATRESSASRSTSRTIIGPLVTTLAGLLKSQNA